MKFLKFLFPQMRNTAPDPSPAYRSERYIVIRSPSLGRVTFDVEDYTVYFHQPNSPAVAYYEFKELWRNCELIRYEFPLIALSPLDFQWDNGWSLATGSAPLILEQEEVDTYLSRIDRSVSNLNAGRALWE